MRKFWKIKIRGWNVPFWNTSTFVFSKKASDYGIHKIGKLVRSKMKTHMGEIRMYEGIEKGWFIDSIQFNANIEKDCIFNIKLGKVKHTYGFIKKPYLAERKEINITFEHALDIGFINPNTLKNYLNNPCSGEEGQSCNKNNNCTYPQCKIKEILVDFVEYMNAKKTTHTWIPDVEGEVDEYWERKQNLHINNVSDSHFTEFCCYLTGHDEATISQMYEDWKRYR